MTDKTLCFLVRKSKGEIAEVCLGLKKKGFGQGLWAGIGGKVGDKLQETTKDAAVRETAEEIGVAVNQLQKVAEITFLFAEKKAWNQRVHVFVCETWQGNPKESEEMKPQWFIVTAVPYHKMWEDAQHWLKEILQGKTIKATFTYDGKLKVVEKELEEVEIP